MIGEEPGGVTMGRVGESLESLECRIIHFPAESPTDNRLLKARFGGPLLLRQSRLMKGLSKIFANNFRLLAHHSPPVIFILSISYKVYITRIMSTDEFVAEVRAWINGSVDRESDREALLADLTPIADSTVQAIKSGRYVPSPRTRNRILDVMAQWPKDKPVPVRKVAAG
jgi:hypothetical protein